MELMGDGGDGAGAGYKNTVYFDNVRVSAENLIGGENEGWAVASTHLELEHGAGGRVGRNRWFLRARDRAKELKRGGKPILDNPDAREKLAELFITTEVSRLFALRNFWMNRSHQQMTYEGPQSLYFGKLGGLKSSQLMMDLLGPHALTSDEAWDTTDGMFETYMQSSIVALHPGATTDIQKVIMARRIGIGRSQREQAGRTVE
jgi:alkylation response protein AidB-like acyl-CoA dehydrogenase